MLLALPASAQFKHIKVLPELRTEQQQPKSRPSPPLKGEFPPTGNIKIRGTDLLVDWPKLMGRRVHVKGGRVVAARVAFALLQVQGGHVNLSPPWFDREQLRYVLNYCTSLLTSRMCEWM